MWAGSRDDYWLRDIEIDLINAADRQRPVDRQKMEALARSIEEIGLRTPLTLELESVEDEAYRLVTGAHRLEACRRLGWTKVPAFIFNSEVDARLWEIDENLMRAELTPAQIAQHLALRKELFQERCNNSVITGGNDVSTHPHENVTGYLSDGRRAPPQNQKQFAADTAEKTGLSKQHINQSVRRGRTMKASGRDLVGTSLDKATELDALTKLKEQSPDRFREITALAAAGEKVSAVKVLEAIRPASKRAKAVSVSELVDRFNSLSLADRQTFFERIGVKPIYVGDRASSGPVS
ncbi:MAG: ParB N-terminal domain-containing protein [Pseudomonadota bacterium]